MSIFALIFVIKNYYSMGFPKEETETLFHDFYAFNYHILKWSVRRIGVNDRDRINDIQPFDYFTKNRIFSIKEWVTAESFIDFFLLVSIFKT